MIAQCPVVMDISMISMKEPPAWLFATLQVCRLHTEQGSFVMVLCYQHIDSPKSGSYVLRVSCTKKDSVRLGQTPIL
jgi:hypothetical protein